MIELIKHIIKTLFEFFIGNMNMDDLPESYYDPKNPKL